MLNLAEYRTNNTGLCDYLPWACLVAPGIVLNKDGSFQRTLRYRGPDLDSATEAELVSVTARLNNVLKRFGEGWALFFEAERVPASAYPGARFADAASWLVDQERFHAFSAEDAHHESRYTLTFLYLPPPEREGRAERILYERTEGAGIETDAFAQLEWFKTETDRALEMLSAILPEAEALSDPETLTYLHGTISDKRHPVAVPAIPAHLDGVLCDTPLLGGVEPKLGDQHLRLLTVLGFPNATTPGLLDTLNDLGFSYRWTTRWIALDKTQANKHLTKLRRQWFSKRKSVGAVLREVMFNRETALVDPDAENKALDADTALQELGSDDVAFGYLTTTIVVADPDPKRANEKLLAVERIVNGRGFVTIRETLNAVEAWLGSLPGNPYANVRQPIVHTLEPRPHDAGLGRLGRSRGQPAPRCPADDTDRNAWLDAVPSRSARRRCRTHAGGRPDRRRQIGATVVARAAVPPLHRRPGRDLRSRPLGTRRRARHERRLDRARARRQRSPCSRSPASTSPARWRSRSNGSPACSPTKGVKITPDIKDAVWTALQSLASAPKSERTLTGLAVLVQSNAIIAALTPYTLEGAYGRLLDGASETLALTDVLHFEMEPLMQHKALVPPVLTYLFHRLEARFASPSPAGPGTRPTLLILDEAWTFLDDPLFAARIREWLKTLRKKNVAVVFATQSLADIERSSIAPAILESCPTRIFLPNDRALEPQARAVYARFGLNDRQVEILSLAAPKRDYYAQTARGNRLFELGLGPIALALCGVLARPINQPDRSAIARVASGGDFADAFLRAKGLPWAADCSPSFPGNATPPAHRRPSQSRRRCRSRPQCRRHRRYRQPIDPAAGPTKPRHRRPVAGTLLALSHRPKAEPGGTAQGVTRASQRPRGLSHAGRPRDAHAPPAVSTVFDPLNYQENVLSAVAPWSRSTTRCASCRTRHRWCFAWTRTCNGSARRSRPICNARWPTSRRACARAKVSPSTPRDRSRLRAAVSRSQPPPRCPPTTNCATPSPAGTRSTPASNALLSCKARSSTASAPTPGYSTTP